MYLFDRARLQRLLTTSAAEFLEFGEGALLLEHDEREEQAELNEGEDEEQTDAWLADREHVLIDHIRRF